MFTIILLSMPGYPICCLPFVFADESYVYISELSHVLYLIYPSHIH